MVTTGEQSLEDTPCFVSAANGSQRIDVPERADRECDRRRAEVVRRSVPQEMSAPSELPANPLNRGDEALIGCGYYAKLVQQQDAGVDLVAVEAA